MKVLYINACVRSESRTEQLSRYFIEKRYSSEDTIEECYLPDCDLKPMGREDLNKRNSDCASGDYSSDEYKYAKQFADCDEIVIAAPYWDCSFPSMLKVYIEHISVDGLTFKYGESGEPIKMCRAKRLTYIVTAGGYMHEPNSLEMYIREISSMYMIDDVRFYAAQGLDIWGNDPEKILDEAKTHMEQ